jgi:hypothetical protein
MSELFSGFRRHLEGWELGVVAVGIAILSALLMVPRAAPPDVLPVPEVDRREQQREQTRDRERTKLALIERLPYEVRSVGEVFRRCGALLASADRGVGAELADLVARARSVRASHGDESLLRLRALQTQFFLDALREWEATGKATRELAELGGDFLTKARQSRWIVEPHRLLLSEEERRLLFRVRWTELTGLRASHPHALSLNEWRAYYRLLLEHPEAGGPEPRNREATLARLRYVLALERRDPEYPAALARGILRYWLGDYAVAQADFRLHISRRPHGPWRLRARNHLVAALDPRP